MGLLIAVTVLNPSYINRHTAGLRSLAMAVAGVFSAFNLYALVRLISEMVNDRWTEGAQALLLTGGAIWLTNIVVMALWYWEHDLGGPAHRANRTHSEPSFLFAQMTAPEYAERNWAPKFVDYVYLSFTNASAFSPTDVLPLKRWAKLVMMGQSVLSLVTVATVIARAINTL